MAQETLLSVMWQPGWEGSLRRLETCLCLAESLCCPSESITTLLISSAAATAAKSLQSCPTLRDPIDGSPPGSPVPGILQARILEWVAKPSSRDLPNPGIEPRSPVLQVDSLLSEPH